MSDWKEKIKAAREMVSALCLPRGARGARQWSMGIPARHNYDPDLVIARGLTAAEARIRELEAEVDALERERNTYANDADTLQHELRDITDNTEAAEAKLAQVLAITRGLRGQFGITQFMDAVRDITAIAEGRDDD